MSSPKLETRTLILQATRQLMERQRGRGVRMTDIAAAVGISRQAVYLHFRTRAELLVATTRYLDEVLELDRRLQRFQNAVSGIDQLEAYIEFWGNYIPEIYGVAKALLAVQDTDEDAAAAWADRMNALRTGCLKVVETLKHDGSLAPQWEVGVATDALWTLLSVRNWEQLIHDCGWTMGQYIHRMQGLTRRILVIEAPG